mmetsp:Transcript_62315/g.71454  ORF Transcript_62315/g.71454 Transcript_62315/m.71454 type:complete len:163 (+) Transcript_62315:585-1073(+)
MFSIFANLWLYTIVFTTNVIAVITKATDYDTCYDYDSGHCFWLYKFLIVFFVIVVATISLLEIKEQKTYQILMCWCRLSLMGLMIFVSIYKMSFQSLPEEKVPAMDFYDSHGMISTLALTVGFQLSMPNVLCKFRKRKRERESEVLEGNVSLGHLILRSIGR